MDGGDSCELSGLTTDDSLWCIVHKLQFDCYLGNRSALFFLLSLMCGWVCVLSHWWKREYTGTCLVHVPLVFSSVFLVFVQLFQEKLPIWRTCPRHSEPSRRMLLPRANGELLVVSGISCTGQWSFISRLNTSLAVCLSACVLQIYKHANICTLLAEFLLCCSTGILPICTHTKILRLQAE